jgi:hypothetical protein
MIINNKCGYLLTFDFSTNPGLDTNAGATLANNNYMIFQVTLTSTVSGSEAVYFDSIATGTN